MIVSKPSSTDEDGLRRCCRRSSFSCRLLEAFLALLEAFLALLEALLRPGALGDHSLRGVTRRDDDDRRPDLDLVLGASR